MTLLTEFPTETVPQPINLINRYASLGRPFHVEVKPTPLNNPYWIHTNDQLATELNVNLIRDKTWLNIISGNKTFASYRPLASLYAGHQFGEWVSELGDGRAMIIAEHQAMNKKTWELQLKGSGTTPFSRMGDGKAVLRSTIREYLCSHAMKCLGIPTTYALAIIGSQDPVYREKVETAAIVLRAAESFIRFGHLEVLCYRALIQQLKTLLDFIICYFYPQAQANTDPYLAFYQEVVKNTANLIAKWQAVGFCHGVLNTDNMSILGLTIDYGPFGFLDEYNPQYICNHSDVNGRYSYANQPYVGQWNLTALAYALSPVVKPEALEQVLADYSIYFTNAYLTEMGKKLGCTNFAVTDAPLLNDLLAILSDGSVDWTIFWHKLSFIDEDQAASQEEIINEMPDRERFRKWLAAYLVFIKEKHLLKEQRQQLMRHTNPKYILRNYLLQQAIKKAELGDFFEVENLFKVVTEPYALNPAYEAYAMPPPSWAKTIKVSCSS